MITRFIVAAIRMNAYPDNLCHMDRSTTQKQERDSCVQEEKQYTKQYKTQNTRNRTQENIQRILKNISRVIRRQQREANDNDNVLHR